MSDPAVGGVPLDNGDVRLSGLLVGPWMTVPSVWKRDPWQAQSHVRSALVKSRGYERTLHGIRQAIRYSRIDVVAALGLAIFVNGAILILAAAAFHGRGMGDVGIEDAYQLLAPALGTGAASTLFAVALLASGHDDQTVRLWNAKSGQSVTVLKGHMDKVLAIAFSPQATLLASASRDETIRVWDVPQMKKGMP